MARFSIRNFFNWRRITPYSAFISQTSSFDKCEKFDENYPILWSRAFYEIFNPIDIVCDRACNLPFKKVDDNGNIIEFNVFEKAFMQKGKSNYNFYSIYIQLCL